MTEKFNVELNRFPASLRRIVASWYEWQGFYLWSRGRRPGEVHRAAEKWETTDQVFWGARPPMLLAEGTFVFDNAAGDLRFYVVEDSDVYYMDVEERGARERYWMFRKFEDLEKFLLFLISDDARPGNYPESPRARWRALGPASEVILAQPDPENFPGRMSITIVGEEVDRCWMGRSDAIAFSHGILISYEELNAFAQEGLPSDGFQVEVRDF